jgi:hypothetical protein
VIVVEQMVTTIVAPVEVIAVRMTIASYSVVEMVE